MEKGLWVSFEPMIRSKRGCCRRVWRTCWVRWKHLCFFVHQIVERLDLNAVENSYSDEGQPGYDPRLLLKLWLYAYCLAVTSSRRLEQRTREDLGFRFLAGGAMPAPHLPPARVSTSARLTIPLL